MKLLGKGFLIKGVAEGTPFSSVQLGPSISLGVLDQKSLQVVGHRADRGMV